MLEPRDFKKLTQYEADLKRAHFADYKLPTPQSEDSVIQEILLKYEPGEGERINWNCGNCSLRAYSRVGRLYFEYKNSHPNKGNKSE